MKQGIVKRVVREKGFGFIKETGGDEEYFFHRSAVQPQSGLFDSINEGDKVSFDVGNGPKGPRADNVTLG